jgi:hypothetical protein
MAATSRCGTSIDLTPVKLLITAGTKAATKITMTLAELPNPSQTIANGIHARGGMGLKVKKIGLIKASIFLLAPIKIPNKIPKEEDTRNPAVTRSILCKIC